MPPYVRSAVQYQPWLPATVPGHVHLDLVENGLIADPFERMNELGARWVDEADWSYKTYFDWSPDEALPHRVLRFEGLDTVCKIYLNGELIGEMDNMFLPLEVDVADKLLTGSNALEVRFDSAVRIGEERRADYFKSEGLQEDCKVFDERAFVRKAQYMSAWDWGPRLVSCGIWRPVSLLEYQARVTSFTVFQSHQQDGSVHISTETKVHGSGQLTLKFGEVNVSSSTESIQELDFTISQPRLWWPNGMGEQPLYEASATVGESAITKQIGLRTVVLEREPDDVGESFTFIVNGEKLWARGANWIPNDSFPSQIMSEEYLEQISICKELGMNMLRVWGGGLYELEGFYDACDIEGILVWQDFAYACSYYPDGPEGCKIAAKEAEYHILRLRDRTSLALWCGNNENLTMWQGKWGGAQSPARFYGENIYYKVLPDLIYELDSSRSYIPSSPIGQADLGSGDCNQGKYGDSHYWAVWHGLGDWIHYKESDTRFSSEFGFASSCSLSMWEEVLEADDWNPHSPAVRWHDKTGKEWEKFYEYVTTHYPSPESLEDWTYYSQLNQRDALRYGIEHWRRADYCQGTLIWQFNDCWPVQSWAVQDYLRLLKPAGYELHRLYRDRLISLVRDGGNFSVWMINDSREPWIGSIQIQCWTAETGKIQHSENLEHAVQAGKRVKVKSFETDSWAPGLIRVQASNNISVEGLTHEPKEINFAKPKIELELFDDRLEVTAHGLVVDLVMTDVDDPGNLVLRDIPCLGTPAITLINEKAIFDISAPPDRIFAKWLHGEEFWDMSGDGSD